MNVEGESVQTEVSDQALGDFGETIEAVGELGSGRHCRATEPDVIRGHQVVRVGQRIDQVPEHVGTRRKAM